MKFKKIISALMLTSAVTAVNADVCKHAPGSVTCGKGTVGSLSGNGMVTVNGTTVEGATLVNGMLNADDANFASLNVNGSAVLIQCVVNQNAEIKGSLKASLSIFEKSLDIFSSSIRLINSKINENLQIHHTDNKTQEVILENNSEVSGDIVFDDGHGKVYIRGDSKVGGNVIGGEIIKR
ncbi:hypothetical protein [Legionella yabuuchiae]|uniref:hypothetical protein n=1 Tax=Legionella yabuuchiae TaxID=376727 RepID=UPI0010566C64|nr:hypothetical protein [Legionella yabuuchiae]